MSWTARLTIDKREIHAFLQRDPVYGAYAIGDLEPEQFAWCTWYVAECDGEVVSLALVYRRLEPPVVLTLGDPAGVAAIFAQTPLPERIYMNALAPHLAVFQSRYDFSGDRVRPMVRMVASPATFRTAEGRGDPAPTSLWTVAGQGDPVGRLRRLSFADVPAIEALIAEGGAFAPDAFSPEQVAEGVFYGLEVCPPSYSPPLPRGIAKHPGPSTPLRSGTSWLAGSEDRRGRRPKWEGRGTGLLSVAGTHLVAPSMGVAAVGNIYTHPAHRGRGCGSLVTSAVTADLLGRGLQVVLNVDEANQAAIHIYQELGYRIHGPFVEGIGVMRETTQIHTR